MRNVQDLKLRTSHAGSSTAALMACLVLAPWVSLADEQDDQSENEVSVCPGVDPEANLINLGIVLPVVPPPVANFVPAVQTGNLMYLAGNGPRQSNGTFITGKVGANAGQLTVAQGYEAARVTAINQLAVLKAELGSLKRVKRIVKVFGMVNSDPNFTNQPAVLNGYSDLMVAVFGNCGKHARSAVGMVSLPFNIAVEVDMVVETQKLQHD